MTSDQTYEPYLLSSPLPPSSTLKLLDEQNYFGLKKENVTVMKQDNVPAIADKEGHVAVDANGHIITKPHGHGDVHLLMNKVSLLSSVRHAIVESPPEVDRYGPQVGHLLPGYQRSRLPLLPYPRWCLQAARLGLQQYDCPS